ncbi:MAG: hypothetical protein AB7J40_00845 [Candidatus Altimarinota bacterium]
MTHPDGLRLGTGSGNPSSHGEKVLQGLQSEVEGALEYTRANPQLVPKLFMTELQEFCAALSEHIDEAEDRLQGFEKEYSRRFQVRLSKREALLREQSYQTAMEEARDDAPEPFKAKDFKDRMLDQMTESLMKRQDEAVKKLEQDVYHSTRRVLEFVTNTRFRKREPNIEVTPELITTIDDDGIQRLAQEARQDLEQRLAAFRQKLADKRELHARYLARDHSAVFRPILESVRNKLYELTELLSQGVRDSKEEINRQVAARSDQLVHELQHRLTETAALRREIERLTHALETQQATHEQATQAAEELYSREQARVLELEVLLKDQVSASRGFQGQVASTFKHMSEQLADERIKAQRAEEAAADLREDLQSQQRKEQENRHHAEVLRSRLIDIEREWKTVRENRASETTHHAFLARVRSILPLFMSLTSQQQQLLLSETGFFVRLLDHFQQWSIQQQQREYQSQEHHRGWKEQMEVVDRRLSEETQKRKDAQAEADRLQEDILSLKKRLSTVLEAHQKSLSRHRLTAAESEQTIAELEQLAVQSNTKITAQTKIIAEHRAEVEDLRKQIRDLRANQQTTISIVEHHQRLTEMQAELDRVRQERDDAMAAGDSLGTQLSRQEQAHQQQVTLLNHRQSGLQRSLQETRDQWQASIERGDFLENRITQLQSDLTRLRNDLSSAEKARETLSQELIQSQGRVQGLEKGIVVQRESEVRLRKRLETLQRELAEVRGALVEEKGAKGNVEKRASHLASNLELIEAQMEHVLSTTLRRKIISLANLGHALQLKKTVFFKLLSAVLTPEVLKDFATWVQLKKYAQRLEQDAYAVFLEFGENPQLSEKTSRSLCFSLEGSLIEDQLEVALRSFHHIRSPRQGTFDLTAYDINEDAIRFLEERFSKDDFKQLVEKIIRLRCGIEHQGQFWILSRIQNFREVIPRAILQGVEDSLSPLLRQRQNIG